MENWFNAHRAYLIQCATAALRQNVARNRGRLAPFQLPKLAEQLIAGLIAFDAAQDEDAAAALGRELGRHGLVLASLQAVNKSLLREARERQAEGAYIVTLSEYLCALIGAMVEADNEDLREQRDHVQRALERVVVAREQEMRQLIHELSTPIMPIHDGVLALPLVGQVDSERARTIMERLLAAIAAERANIVILDITGVPGVDQDVAAALIHVAQAAQLLGAAVILVGVRPEIARTIAELDVDMTGLLTLANLRRGIEHALRTRGLFIRRSSPPRAYPTESN